MSPHDTHVLIGFIAAAIVVSVGMPLMARNPKTKPLAEKIFYGMTILLLSLWEVREVTFIVKAVRATTWDQRQLFILTAVFIGGAWYLFEKWRRTILGQQAYRVVFLTFGLVVLIDLAYRLGH